jgi:predicted GNAT family acetyltransferase
MLWSVRIVRHETAREFLEAAGPFLHANETTNHLVFAIAERQPEGAYFASAGEHGVALMTPPYPLLVSDLPEAALAPLIDSILESGFATSGVSGPSSTARAFASRWCARHRLVAIPRMRMRSHVLEHVTVATRAPGAMRAANVGDRRTIARWAEVYLADTRSPNHESPDALAERLLSNMYLWERDGTPLSMAAIAGRTPRGRRVGFVFTPPEVRRRGYAEALVAALSHRILDEGSRWCFLYTDVENPTSNAIYRRIGYEPNGEIEQLEFQDP